MKRLPLPSLRASLFLLLVLAIAPPFGLALYDSNQLRQSATLEAQANALRIARLAAADQDRLIDAVHQYLATLAQLPEVRGDDPAACNTFLADLLKQTPRYSNLSVANLRGEIICSAIPLSTPTPIADLLHFQNAVRTLNFAIGNYRISQATGNATLPLGYPVFDRAGKLKAVVTAGLDLSWITQFASQANLPPGSILTISDVNHVILARYPNTAQFLGQVAPETDLWRKTAAGLDEGTFESNEIDQVSRLYAFTSFSSSPNLPSAIFVSVGIPTSIAYAPVEQIVTRDLIVSGGVGVLVLLVIWYLGEIAIVRRVKALADTAKQFGKGNWNARTQQPYTGGELGDLAQVFDEMATTLQMRNAEQRQAEAALVNSQMLYHSLVDMLPQSLLRRDTQGRITFANQKYCDDIGKPLDQLIGKTDFDLHPRELAEQYQRDDQRVIETGVSLEQVEEHTPLNGPTTHVQVIKSPIVDAQGQVTGLQVMFWDITARRRAEQELRWQIAEMEALTRVSREITSVSDLNAVLTLIARLVAELVPADASGVYMFESDQRLCLSASYGVSEAYVRELNVHGIAVGTGVVGRAVSERQPVQLPDLLADANYAYKKLAETEHLRAILAVPILRGDQASGGIVLWHRTPRQFTAQQIAFVQAIAQQCVNAVENARLLQAEREQREWVEALRDTAAVLSGTLDFDAVLDRILEGVGRVVPHDVASVMLIEQDCARVVRSCASNQASAFKIGIELDLAETENLRRMMETNKSLIINDTYAYPNWVRLPDTAWIRAHIGVPICVHGKPIGFLNLDSAQVNFFAPAHAARLQAFADQAAVALENARLLSETQTRARQFAALYDTAHDLALQQNTPALLETVAQRAIAMLGMEHGGLYLYDPARAEMELVVQQGYPVPLKTRLQLGEGMAGHVAQTRQPLIVDDYQSWAQRSPKFQSIPFSAVVQVPIVYGGDLIGVLSVDQVGVVKHKFDQTDVRLLELFASQAASAVHNARLYEETRMRADQLALLYDAGLALNSVLDPRAQLEFLLKIAMQASHADRAVFFRYDAARGEYSLESGIGYASDVIDALTRLNGRPPDGNLLINWVVENRLILNVPDVSAEPRYVMVDPAVRSGVWVPVEHENQLRGVLGMMSTRLNAFAPADERLLMLFANQVAVALENARLFDALQLSLDMTTQLYQLSGRILTATTETEAAHVVTDTLRVAFQADVALVYLIDPQGNVEFQYGSGLPDSLPAGAIALRPAGLSMRAWTLGQVIVANDPALLSDQARAYGIQSAIVLPLLGDPLNIGVLFLDYRQPHVFTDRQIELLSLYANQAALTLRRVRLIAETRRRADQLAMLNRIASAVNQTLDLDSLLNVIYREITAVFPADAGFIALYDHAANTLDYRIRVDLGVTQPAVNIAPRSGFTLHVLKTKAPLLIRDREKEKHLYPQADSHVWGSLQPAESWLGVPIINGNELVGIVNVQTYQKNSYTAEDEQLLVTIADQVAVAIQNARLFQATQQQLVELQTVNKISVALRGASTPEEMLPTLLDEILATLGTSAGNIAVYDLGQGKLKASCARGWMDHLDKLDVRPHEGIIGRVFATSEPYQAREFATDSLTRDASRPQIPPGWGGVYVPIRAVQTVIGALAVSVQLPREIQPNELQLLMTLAEVAGNAVHRASLNQQTERHVQRLNALHTIDAAISATLDLRVTLNILLDQVAYQLGADATDILQVNSNLQLFDYAAGHGFHSNALARMRLPLGEGYASRAVMERQIIRVPNLAEAQDDRRASALLAEGFVSYYAVPLMPKGQVKGVLEIFQRTPLDPDPEWLGFFETLAGQAAIAIDNATLFDGLQRSHIDLTLAYDATIEGWSRALDLRDEETEGHTERVTDLTLQLAQRFGVPNTELADIRRGALLHDIGKMGIPDRILFKQTSLDEAEWTIMRRHPQYAYELLSPIDYLRRAIDIPYCHHEKWDGTGYPRGLRGEDIPLVARLFAVVDVWDALRSNRPYRQAWDEARVRAHIESLTGTHFDPRVAQVFLTMMRKK